MSVGDFKVVRIDRDLTVVTLYNNAQEEGYPGLEYLGRIEKGEGQVLIASGSTRPSRSHLEIPFQEKTKLFQIDKYGRCAIIRNWNMRITSSNGVAEAAGFLYFGQNKMVTRINMDTGETVFFTNKNEEELAALVDF